MANPQLQLQQAYQMATQGQIPEAIALLRRLVKYEPRFGNGFHLLGMLLAEIGELESADKAFERAVALLPNDKELRANYGMFLFNQKELDRAELQYLALKDLLPTDPEPLERLVATYFEQRRYLVAAESSRELIESFPQRESGYIYLATAMCSLGQADSALTLLREYESKFVNSELFCHALATTSLYATNCSASESARYHHAYGKEKGGLRNRRIENPDPNRVLRIAYLSPDFGAHSVGYFLENILENHDRSQVHVTGYPTIRYLDDASIERFANKCDHWVELFQMDDEAVSEQVKRDKIDILVELAGLSAQNRLGVMRHNPSAVQVTYIGYPHSTGFETVDYRIVDSTTDPDGSDELNSETVYRLPGCFLCYRPPNDAVEISGPAFEKNGEITFGCFNAMTKINEASISQWCAILSAVPNSRFIMKNMGLRDPSLGDTITKQFEQRGIDRSRIDLIGYLPDPVDHYKTYLLADIALDTFPYNGTTTTCEQLYMGLPTLSLCGNRHVCRVGKSLLTAIGIPELVANTPEEYVALAVELAKDKSRIKRYRETLRDQMLSSPLCDGPGFTRKLEAAYRDMWIATIEGRKVRGAI